ncbi:hypothetical protein ABWH91_06560 [Phycisphaerales bacterium ac7]
MSHHRMIQASAAPAQPTALAHPNPGSHPKTLALTAQAEFEIEGADTVSGDAGAAAPLPRFRMMAYSGGPMRVAGWRHPVVIDLAGLAIPSPSRPIRFGHDATAGVGHTDQVMVEEGRLVATGMISRDTPAAREVVVSARNGFPWQASVGASVEAFEFLRENQTATVNGREVAGPLNIVRKSTLGEISFVDLGADGSTSATIAAGAAAGDDASDPVQGAGTPAPKRTSPRSPTRCRPCGSRSPPRASGSPPCDGCARASTPRSRPARSARAGTRPRPNWRSCGPADPRPLPFTPPPRRRSTSGFSKPRACSRAG